MRHILIRILYFSRYDNDESIKLEIANTIKSITNSFDNILLAEEVILVIDRFFNTIIHFDFKFSR